jgi:hypothetical protein
MEHPAILEHLLWVGSNKRRVNQQRQDQVGGIRPFLDTYRKQQSSRGRDVVYASWTLCHNPDVREESVA